jgi:membrane protease YdiL (CAAX protease family)
MTTPELQTAVPQPAPRHPLSTFVCWLLILTLLAAVVYRNTRVQPAGDVQKLMDDQRARLVGLLAVQVKALGSGKNNPLSLQTKESQDQLVRDMERDAHSPEDEVRTAIVIGELRGGDAALGALGKLVRDDNSPAAAEDVAVLQALYESGPQTLGAAARDRLTQRYGDLGKIALAYGVPPEKEPRKSLQAAALVLTIRLGVLAVGFCIVAVTSLALFIMACVWALRGKIRAAYVPDPTVGTAFLEAFTIYLVLFLLLGLLLRFAGGVNIQWMWLAVIILPVMFGWVAWRGVSIVQWCQALGWHSGRGLMREIAAGIGGYVAGLGVIVLGGLVTYLLVRFSGARVSSPVVQELRGDAWHVLGVYAVACIFAPVMEETMFRGALFHHLRQRWGWAISAPIVAFIFAMLHPQGWVAVPALGSIALVLAALREWRGSLIAPIAAHACNNFMVLTVTLLVLQ